jgi:hypothetical protein
VKKDWSARQFQKLLGGLLAAHPRALPRGSNDRNVHKKVTGKK